VTKSLGRKDGGIAGLGIVRGSEITPSEEEESDEFSEEEEVDFVMVFLGRSTGCAPFIALVFTIIHHKD